MRRRTNNPVFKNLARTYVEDREQNPDIYRPRNTGNPILDRGTGSITVHDIVMRTAATLGVISIFAIVCFFISLSNPGLGMILSGVGAIGGLLIILFHAFSSSYASAVTTLLYASLEGLFVGGISFAFAKFSVANSSGFDIIIQAVFATMGVFAGMLFAYSTGAIRVTQRFRRFITGAIISILVLAIGNLILALLTGHNPLTDGGPLAIVFSVFCIAIASLSFLTDFDAATTLIRANAPKKAAWSVALGLAVTLVWLYMEILRLLSYFRN